MTATVLRRLELLLFAVGIALALWCAATIIESRFFKTLPVPSAAIDRPAESPRGTSGELPGDAGANASHPPTVAPRPAPAAGSVLGKLTVPSLHFSATVLEGSDDATLSRGAGHIEDTAFFGEKGNVGIAGHRDTTFRAVRNLHPGDELDIVTGDHTYHYQITRTFIVEPTDVYVLDPGPVPMLTLVTCYPFEYIGHAPHRYIVQAVLIDGSP